MTPRSGTTALRVLGGILRTMGGALALAHAGEMLDDQGKQRALAHFPGVFPMVPDGVPARVVVASDRHLDAGIVQQGIALCREKRALLDLLCISTGGPERPGGLQAVLPRLVAEDGLDFQITRRQGDLLAELESYLRLRRDTVAIVLHVGEGLRRRAQRYRHRHGRRGSEVAPAVWLFEEAPGT